MAGHAHDLGKYVGIFINQLDNGKGWVRVFEKPNPDFSPFQDLEPRIRIDSNFELATRCIYDTTNVTHSVAFGLKHDDEMCLAVLYYLVEGEDVTLNDCVLGVVDPKDQPQLPEPIEQQLVGVGDEIGQIPEDEQNSNFLFFLAMALFILLTLFLFRRKATKKIYYRIGKNQKAFP